MIATILTILKNKYVIGVLAVIAVLGLLSAFWLRGNYYENKIEKIKAQYEAQRTQYMDRLIAENKDHLARIKAIEANGDEIKKQIKNLKLEGKCIKDENYWITLGNIADQWNRGVQP